MTTATERPRQTVLGIVKSKAETKDGEFKVEVEIASFESQYPTTLTRISEELAARLKIGQQYPLLLERQNLKKGKTGSKPYDYYWGLLDIAKEAPAEAVPAFTPKPLLPYQPDSRERSIERQVAVKAAVELAMDREHPMKTEDIILVAYKFAQFMETGTLPDEVLKKLYPPMAAASGEAPFEDYADPGAVVQHPIAATAPTSSTTATPMPATEKLTIQDVADRLAAAGRTGKDVNEALDGSIDAWVKAKPGRTPEQAMKLVLAHKKGG